MGSLVKKEKMEERFKTVEIVDTLADLMKKVTSKDCTPDTVNAACNCASSITELLKVHIEAKKIAMLHDDFK